MATITMGIQPRRNLSQILNQKLGRNLEQRLNHPPQRAPWTRQSLAIFLGAITATIFAMVAATPAMGDVPAPSIEVASSTSSADAPSEAAQSHYQAGLTLAHRGSFVRAIAEFDEAIRLAPNFSQAFQDRGSSHLALGNAVAAMGDYNRAIRLTPDDSNAYYNRGNLNLQLERYSRAIVDYDRAISLNEADAAAWQNRALAHATTGDLERAVDGFQQAARLYQLQNNQDGYRQVLRILEYFQPDLDSDNLPATDRTAEPPTDQLQ
ncbi:MAG: tetratricopeptide repeat protein [Cyanobacteria bacterium P01_C01_bin.89]